MNEVRDASGRWPTELAELLAGQGPMPFRDYMAEALYADKHGFYTQRDRRRSKRETATLSVVSGIAQRLAGAFLSFAEAHEPHLVDQGPGSGLLVRYVLGSLPEETLDEIEVTFVEPNLARRTRLVVMLQEFGVEGQVVGSPRAIDPGPAFVVAKELVGSFPVHWLERTDGGWREVHVAFDEGTWGWTESLEDPPPSLERFAGQRPREVPTGHRYEANLQVRGWLASVAEALDPGLVVVLDRPMAQPPGKRGSIRAVRDGEPVEPYAAPGDVDISAGVDLDLLADLGDALGLVDATRAFELDDAGGDELSTLALGTTDAPP